MDENRSIPPDQAVQLLKQVAALCGNLRNYPRSHPAPAEMATRAIALMQDLLGRAGKLAFTFASGSVQLNGQPLREAMPVPVVELGDSFRQLNVDSVTFCPGVDHHELLSLGEFLVSHRVPPATEREISALTDTRVFSHVLVHLGPRIRPRSRPAREMQEETEYGAEFDRLRDSGQQALLQEETIVRIGDIVRLKPTSSSLADLLSRYERLLKMKDSRLRSQAARAVARITVALLRTEEYAQSVRFTDRLVEALFRERDQELYGRLVQSLEGIAQESLLEHRPLLAGRISDVLAEQLRLLSTRPQAQILIRALANIGDAKAILGLASALHVRVLSPQISTTLTRLGSKAVSPLLHLLEISEDRSVRLELLPVLARIGSTAVDPLLRALSDERWYVRRNASLLLGYTRDVNAVLPLRECLRDSDPRIRLEAVRALVEIQGEDAEPAVVPLLKDPDRSVRLEAIALMAKIGRDRSVWTLLGILRKRINPFAGRNDEERTAACQALSSIGDRRAEPALRRLLRDRSYVVRNAARSALTALQEKASQIERPT